jgi:hypothetical protein
VTEREQVIRAVYSTQETRRNMKHSNVQENFSTGAKRDTQSGKLRYDLISPLALTRLAVIYTKGAEHYGDRNWEKGMPFSRVMASLQRHLFAFLMGDTSEDHLAQMVWNGVALLHYQEAIQRGILPPTLNDMPDYAGRVEPAPFPNDERRHHVYRDLMEVGCPAATAEQVAGGITFAEEVPGVYQPWVYIAGPMRGVERFNFPAFDAARDQFVKLGFNVISPADIDRYANPNADDTAQDVSDQTVFVFRDFFANFFLKKIDRTGQNGIVLLPNWPKSTGGTGELFLDKWLGLKAYRPDGTEYPMDDARHDFALCYARFPNPQPERCPCVHW